MAHTFTVDIPQGVDLAAGVAQVRAGIEEAGGKYQFDTVTNRGEFALKGVVGSFIVAGACVIITILKKPFIVSNGFVEKSIRDAFANQ